MIRLLFVSLTVLCGSSVFANPELNQKLDRIVGYYSGTVTYGKDIPGGSRLGDVCLAISKAGLDINNRSTFTATIMIRKNPKTYAFSDSNYDLLNKVIRLKEDENQTLALNVWDDRLNGSLHMPFGVNWLDVSRVNETECKESVL